MGKRGSKFMAILLTLALCVVVGGWFWSHQADDTIEWRKESMVDGQRRERSVMLKSVGGVLGIVHQNFIKSGAADSLEARWEWRSQQVVWRPRNTFLQRAGFGLYYEPKVTTRTYINGRPVPSQTIRGSYLFVFVPWWFIGLILLALAALSWRRYWHQARPIPPGMCKSCGYDLRASPDRCPECGTENIQPSAAIMPAAN